jgi:hypothetical protein
MPERLNGLVLKTSIGDEPIWGSNPCLSATFPFSITVVRQFLVLFVVVRIHEWELNLNYMLLSYYVICIIYCFYQLNKRYKKSGIEYNSPELDAIMVVVMAWVLAPVDVSLTWIRMVKEAEQARRRQNAIDFYGDERLKKMLKD